METYSILTDFGGVKPNIGQLHNEILANNNILKTLYGVSTYEDVLNIEFNSSLTAGEKLELDAIISSHVAVFVPETTKELKLNLRNNSYKSTTFIRASTDNFSGSTYATAKCISYMDSGVTSYTIQIFDKSNKQILLTTTLNNTTESIQNLGTLTNLSENPTQIEVSVKKTGGSSSEKIYLESVTIYYV